VSQLFSRRDRLRVANVGASVFLEPLRSSTAILDEVSWRPPIDGEADTATAVAMLRVSQAVKLANQVAIERALAAEPRVIGVRLARQTMAVFQGDRVLLHAGPPISFAQMCGPMRGALIGAACLEGWAANPRAAEALLDAGDITLDACHHHGAVGPMAGVISPSMAVWILKDLTTDRRSFATLNEGLGKVLRFGANGPEVLERLRWMSAVLAPALDHLLRVDDHNRSASPHSGTAGLPRLDPLPLMAQALHMGDEIHNRNTAATGQLLKWLTVRAGACRWQCASCAWMQLLALPIRRL
jgi:hypothetical protein